MAFGPESRLFRYILLTLNCLMTFGTYFSFDMPSVLQAEFQGNYTCGNNTSEQDNSTCCTDCLGLTPDQYNMLYAVWSWAGAAMVLFNGFLIDKIGNKAGAILFSIIAVVASALFATATMPFLRGTAYMFPLLMTARIAFGTAGGSIRIVQDRLTSFWFRDKELAMAFGATVASSRLGSVLNFIMTESFAVKFGLSNALWGGAVLSGLGLVAAVLATLMDACGTKALGLFQIMKEESKQVKISAVKHFTLQYWLLLLAILFFYSALIPFVADASLFIQDKYNIDKVHSGYIAGAVYDTSVILSPILGYVVDMYGGSGYAAIVSCMFTIPVYCLFALTNIPPVVATVWLGLFYTLGLAGMWSTIPYYSERKNMGTAMGVVTCAQGLGIGVTNLVVGKILGSSQRPITHQEKLHQWQVVMIPLGVNATVATFFALALNIVDKFRNGSINKPHYKTEVSSEAAPENRSPSESDPLLANSPDTRIN